MEEILSGLFHWTAIHPGIRQRVSSYYVEPAATLIDPMVPEEGLGWFEGRSSPQRILLTNRHHYRGSDRFREEFGCTVHCHNEGLHEIEGGPEVEGFEFGEQPAPAVRALEVGAICPDDSALHISVGPGALAFADALVRRNEGAIGFVSDYLMGENPEAVKEGLLGSIRRLLDAGGREALRDFVEAT
jgi:hypothetical protein